MWFTLGALRHHRKKYHPDGPPDIEEEETDNEPISDEERITFVVTRAVARGHISKKDLDNLFDFRRSR